MVEANPKPKLRLDKQPLIHALRQAELALEQCEAGRASPAQIRRARELLSGALKALSGPSPGSQHNQGENANAVPDFGRHFEQPFIVSSA